MLNDILNGYRPEDSQQDTPSAASVYSKSGSWGTAYIGDDIVVKTSKNPYSNEGIDREWAWLCYLNGHDRGFVGEPRVKSANLIKPLFYFDPNNDAAPQIWREFFQNKTFAMSKAPGLLASEWTRKAQQDVMFQIMIMGYNFMLELERLDVTAFAAEPAQLKQYENECDKIAKKSQSKFGQKLQELGLLETAQALWQLKAEHYKPVLQHNDLHGSNCFYDEESCTFTPIDFGLMKASSEFDDLLFFTNNPTLDDMARKYYQAHSLRSQYERREPLTTLIMQLDALAEQGDNLTSIPKAILKQLATPRPAIKAALQTLQPLPLLSAEALQQARKQGWQEVKDLFAQHYAQLGLTPLPKVGGEISIDYGANERRWRKKDFLPIVDTSPDLAPQLAPDLAPAPATPLRPQTAQRSMAPALG